MLKISNKLVGFVTGVALLFNVNSADAQQDPKAYGENCYAIETGPNFTSNPKMMKDKQVCVEINTGNNDRLKVFVTPDSLKSGMYDVQVYYLKDSGLDKTLTVMSFETDLFVHLPEEIQSRTYVYAAPTPSHDMRIYRRQPRSKPPSRPKLPEGFAYVTPERFYEMFSKGEDFGRKATYQNPKRNGANFISGKSLEVSDANIAHYLASKVSEKLEKVSAASQNNRGKRRSPSP